jgi:hypothetical protein
MYKVFENKPKSFHPLLFLDRIKILKNQNFYVERRIHHPDQKAFGRRYKPDDR